MISVVDLRKSFVSPNGERLEVLRGVTFTANCRRDYRDHRRIRFRQVNFASLARWFGSSRSRNHLAKRDRAIASREIGFVFQFHYLLSDLSAVENVALPLLIARRNSRHAHERAMELLKEAGLEARADHPVSHLSGGEQQRVAVARALVTEPKLLLADEPTGNLDAAIGEEIAETLVNYAHKHSTITVIATHSATLAGMCDRSFLLKDGRIYETGNPVQMRI